eukprot:TRINITY_DN5039_c0_g1_i1.p1 TRINITY_DN5039_c0_g1~~TRINITY_DN5039_c0_g1_i1.p1  ORF type:complete len:169 (-),score=50.21 TRINITY_DN5039_c0_g1_i1:236-742(-)
MHNIYTRINTIFSVLSMVAAIIIIVNCLSRIWIDPTPTLDFKIIRTNKIQNPQQPLFYFNLNADFRELFTWNTKYIFMFITVEYSTDTYQSDVVIWDRLIEKNESVLNITNEIAEYPVVDLVGKMPPCWQKENCVKPLATLNIYYDIMPNSGLILKRSALKHQFQITI